MSTPGIPIIAHTLKEVRSSLRLSQSSLALDLGVTRSYLCLIEQGVRSGSIHFWMRASSVLGVPVGILVGDPLAKTEDPDNPK